MAGDQGYSESVDDIARHQLNFLETLQEDEPEHVITLDTLETQRYCEQKAVFERQAGPDEKRPDRIIRAQEQHGKLVAEMAGTEEEYHLTDVWDDIIAGDVSLLYPPLFFKLIGVIIYGRPTYLRFIDSQPTQLTLVRGVTKKRYLDELFPSERFLLWCYCTILDRIGFSVSDLSARYLKYPQDEFNVVEVSRAQMLVAVEDGDDIAIQLDDDSTVHPNIRRHPIEYKRDSETGKQLREYVAFWRDGGEPTGAGHWKQCAGCRFNPECDLALAQGEQRS
ncbi:hypothetical protein [Haloarcula pelagica]|uniref:hypothetical protein n=1 Tax=Haloarcula pelagica TaxID=3033389 RepID=UPI0024C4437D|nr:hypothetical protein [Halomicroarcula sp. YJ-61-S]